MDETLDHSNNDTANISTQNLTFDTIGKFLAHHRSKSGKSLKKIANDTRISLSLLESLENEDYDKLPNKVYVIGYLKSLAKELNYSQSEAIKLFEQGLSKISSNTKKTIPLEQNPKYQPVSYRYEKLTSKEENKSKDQDSNSKMIIILASSIIIIVVIGLITMSILSKSTKTEVAKEIQEVVPVEKTVQTLDNYTPKEEPLSPTVVIRPLETIKENSSAITPPTEKKVDPPKNTTATITPTQKETKIQVQPKVVVKEVKPEETKIVAPVQKPVEPQIKEQPKPQQPITVVSTPKIEPKQVIVQQQEKPVEKKVVEPAKTTVKPPPQEASGTAPLTIRPPTIPRQ